MNFYKNILNDYCEVPDLVNKKINNVRIIYLETLADQDKINEYILKNVTKKIINDNINNVIPSPNVKNITTYEDLKMCLDTGFTILFYKKQILAIETKTNINRSIDKPTTEADLFGPKDALSENYQINMGLIKRRIKSSKLKTTNAYIGKYSKTLVSTMYIDDIADKTLVKKINDLIKKINIDGITDIGKLKEYLIKDNRSMFPVLKISERPDLIASSLLDGKIIILLDTSPYALITPSFLADFINPISDNYQKTININFIKILRFICFFIGIMLPAFYVAITTLNQETIPTSLLINIQNQRKSVPFPAVIECILTLITCEILRESDIRFPSSYGSAISILGALVLGEAAVSAGIVSPIMIIVVAITFITSLIFTDQEIINAIRNYRFLCLFISAIFGLYGVFISFIFLITNLVSYEVFSKPYFYPLSPFDLNYLKQTLIKAKTNKRSKLISKNIKRGET